MMISLELFFKILFNSTANETAIIFNGLVVLGWWTDVCIKLLECPFKIVYKYEYTLIIWLNNTE